MAKKKSKASVAKSVKCHAIIDRHNSAYLGVWMCDSPRYAKRVYMRLNRKDAIMNDVDDLWNEHCAAHLCVIEGKFVPAVRKPAKKRSKR